MSNFINLLDIIYPIGSFYFSSVNNSPSSIIGGTWEKIEGRFLLASGENYISGTTGGEATHTLSASQMPSHSHTVNSHSHSTPHHSHPFSKSRASNYNFGLYSKWDVSVSVNGSFAGNVLTSAGAQNSEALGYGGGGTTGNASPGTTSAGGGQAHNNMPPYLAVYIWHRIS